MSTNNSANQDFSNDSDGFTLGGGTTERKLTVTGGDATITGSGSNVVTFPAAATTLVGRDTTDTLTNKVIDASNNTITNLGSSTLAESAKPYSGGDSASVTTTETTTSSTYTDLTTTTDTVTVTIGANGLALVAISSSLYPSNTGTTAYMSFAVSGANTIAAADKYAIAGSVANAQNVSSRTVLLTGLTAGSTTFKLKAKQAGSTTGNYANRNISVVPL